jgi:hypothetical protein
MNTLRYVLVLILGIALPYALQRVDRRRLTPAQQARAWNTASWAAALYAFGPLSMLGWVWVTRQDVRRWWRASPPLAVARSLLLLGGGLLVMVSIFAFIEGVDLLVAWLAGAPS